MNNGVPALLKARASGPGCRPSWSGGSWTLVNPGVSRLPYVGAALFAFVLGCDAPALPPLPEATVLEGVAARGETPNGAWSAGVAALTLVADVAVAAEVEAQTAAAPGLSVTAKTTTWDLKAKTGRFEGNVVVTRGDVSLSCERLSTTYDARGRVVSAEADGGVLFARGSQRATGKTATLNGETGELLLSGAAQISDGGNTLSGATIRVLLDDDKVTCDGGDAGPCRLNVQGAALGPPSGTLAPR